MTDSLPPAHWAADPSGRHEHRYWDGSSWTDHVADQGRPGLDPVLGDPAPIADDAQPADAQPTEPQPADAQPADAQPADARPTEPQPEPQSEPQPAPEPAPEDSPTWPPQSAEEPADVAVTQAGWATPMAVPPPPPPVAGTGVAGTGFGPMWGASTWRSLDGLRTALVALFAATALGSIWLLGAHAHRIQVIDDFQRSPLQHAQALRDADDALSTAAGFYAIVRVALIVVFIIWMWRASKNALEALQREQPRFTPGWSIGSWFIPFANFVIPVMIIQGLWRASAPGTSRGPWWKDRKGSALVGFWWAAFLTSSIAAFSLNDDAKLDDVKNADTIGAIGAAASVVAAVLAILVVVQLTRRFNERRVEELGS